MHSHLAWSVSLDESIYDLDQSHILATLSEDSLRLNYHFDCTLGTGDGYAKLDRSAYGFGACAIFRPDFNGTAFADYLQNQVWHVRIDGLSLRQGGTTSIEYDVRMASLYVQAPVKVELDRQTLRLNSGETLQLYAMVVPNYADDLSIYWESSDEAVATVDPEGMVRAIGRGEATIFARSANGREDRCVVQVED
ncbi:MAG: Ig domain-containing protein [Clostridia bacterium]|nr:Ig domain-containing protein [Clostridia bacterium]